MAQHKREDVIDSANLVVQLGLSLLGLTALTIGSIGLGKGLSTGENMAGAFAFTAAGAGVLWLVARTFQRKFVEVRSRAPFRPAGWTPPVFPLDKTGTPFPMLSPTAAKPLSDAWTVGSLQAALRAVDWYQFERLCAALLRTEGYDVIRQGAAEPDGSVELIAEKNGERMLAQCKHWRTKAVKEKAIHGLLASMAELQATRGVVYTLHGWAAGSVPRFAQSHAITLVDAQELAGRALVRLTSQQLDDILNPGAHHCASCESPMVLADGSFRSIWGCCTCPQCQATVEKTGT